MSRAWLNGFAKAKPLSPADLEKIIYGGALPDLNKPPKPPTGGGAEARAHLDKALREFNSKPTKESEKSEMTVSLYTSTASGKKEIVVQTNAQSLDLYIAGLADALDSAIENMDSGSRVEMLSSLLRNAFPVAFSIAGYKAERVSESRMLVCGAAAPGESNLLAHSRT